LWYQNISGVAYEDYERHVSWKLIGNALTLLEITASYSRFKYIIYITVSFPSNREWRFICIIDLGLK
jgi:hypothetical protein